MKQQQQIVVISRSQTMGLEVEKSSLSRNYINELLKSIKDMREKREELNCQILEERTGGPGIREDVFGLRLLCFVGWIVCLFLPSCFLCFVWCRLGHNVLLVACAV